MKKTLCLFILVLSFCARAQEVYTIVKVFGKVENGNLKKDLKTGDKIESKDPVRFVSPGSYLIIISPKTGRKVIRGVPDNSPREIFQLLQSFVKPEERSTASRGTGMSYLEELAATFSYNRLLILGDGRIPVDTLSLSLRPPAVIRAYYRQDSKVIYQKVSDESAFYLNQSVLFPKATLGVMPRVSVAYFENEKDDPVFTPGIPIASFLPVFASENELKNEIKAIAQAVDGASSASLFKEITNYLIAEYGGVQDQNVKDWLQSNQLMQE